MGAAAAQSKRYTPLGRLGLGGMAEVLLARMQGPQGFERLVVVKRLLPHLAEDPEHVSMFLDEARLLSRIRHRNVVSVLELLEDEGDYALVMEYLEGENASAYLKRSLKAGPVDPWLGAHVVSEAAAGLHAAHELKGADGAPLQLVHRDVSPQNVFVTYAGEVRLLDFGVARARGRSTRTESGVLKGKLAYMAPEQLSKGAIDRRADIFALGTVLYEITTGTRLFRRDNEMATVNAVCHEPIVPPTQFIEGYPPELEAVVLRALERDLEKRYPTAEALRADLRRVIKDAPFDEAPADRLAARMRALFHERIDRKSELIRGTEAHTPHSEQRAALADAHRSPSKSTVLRRAPRSRRGPIAAVVALVAVLGGAAVAVWTLGGSDDTPAPPPEPVAPAAEVRLELAVEPEGATVRVGERSCASPCTITLPRSDEAVTVRASLAGHVEDRFEVTPDSNQTVRVTLTPEPEPAVTPTPTPPESEPAEITTSPARRRAARRPRAPPTPEAEPDFPVFQ